MRLLTATWLVLLHMNTQAQQLQQTVKDTLSSKAAVKKIVLNRKAGNSQAVETAIEAELSKIVSAYTNRPNTAATWIQVKAAAENILYTYFMNGKLAGTKKEQAFYVKMGTETMTAADIVNKRMILIAGIASIKPAEFTILTIEKKCLL